LISLGSGAATISGYYLMKSEAALDGKLPQTDQATLGPEVDKPQLRKDIVMGRDGEMFTLTRLGQPDPLFVVNGIGHAVLRRLDGCHAIQDISAAVAEQSNAPHSGELDGKIACFVAQLGQLGLLKQPYYVNIVEEFVG